ncbi:MAG: shikimate dehydrogenase [Clostridium sp.]
MEFYGLLGEKLSHSLSPKIHNYIYKELNIEGAYKLFEVEKEELNKLSEGLKLLKIKGINITIPYKEDMIKYLDEISKEAKDIGAINTICLKENKLYGYNTDYYGFGLMLKQNNIDVKGKSAVVLGSGGACKAVISYLINEGATEVRIATRKIGENQNNFPKEVTFITYDNKEMLNGDILINTTPVGMYPKIDGCPLNREDIEKFECVVDLIYNPKETQLMKIAKELGKKVCGGLGMLINQAIKAEEIWLEREIPQEIGEKLYNEINKEFN